MSAEAERPPQRGGRFNFNTVLAAGCVLFALFLFAVIPSEVEHPPVLFGQKSNGLDPAFFPQLVAACFLLIGLGYLYASFSLNDVNGFRGLKRDNYVSIGFTIVMMIVYAATLQPLGFVAASALTVGVLSVFYGARHWLSVVIAALAVPAIIYVVFRRVLAVSLPEFPDF